MTGSETLALDSISLLLVWTAIATYVLAFIAYTIDLAQRSASASVPQPEPAMVNAGSRVSHLGQSHRGGMGNTIHTPPRQRPRLLWARIGTSLTVLGFLFQLAGAILRGVAAERVPWANMYEFALTGTTLIVAVYLLVLRRYDLRFLGGFLICMVVLLLGGATISFYVEVVPLMDPLKSVWLVIHVFVASLATALIAGAIWANDSWGRYWGFDVKEVWTFVIWVLYAGYIHARATRGWRGTRSAWLSIIGFVAVLFNFTIVNMFFQGLHSYSGLT